MVSPKDILLKPVDRKTADAIIKLHHYSGKIVNNSQLHIGVFINGEIHGAMQFGPSMDKRKTLGLVRDTAWNGFLELNRMAFGPALPPNSESRAIAIAMRLIRKHAPHVEWVVSFSDATQCGDGTIYRASGFWLTQIKGNNQIWEAPNGERFARLSLTDGRSLNIQSRAQEIAGLNGVGGTTSMAPYRDAGFVPMPGYQMRYIYPLNATIKDRLTVPILPYSAIDAAGARMYKGVALSRSEAVTPITERPCKSDQGA
jgi:hypothetical protein